MHSEVSFINKKIDLLERQNQVLLQDNASLRTEMRHLKDTLKLLYAQQSKDAQTRAGQVLALQRQRIDFLQGQLQRVKSKYDKLLNTTGFGQGGGSGSVPQSQHKQKLLEQKSKYERQLSELRERLMACHTNDLLKGKR